MTGIKACVFDAHGTLFDVNSAASQARNELGERWQFKPHPSVYRLPADRFKRSPGEMCFLSSNGWDAHAAKAAGFRVLWCNRFGQAPERIPERRDGEIGTVAVLPEIVGV